MYYFCGNLFIWMVLSGGIPFRLVHKLWASGLVSSHLIFRNTHNKNGSHQFYSKYTHLSMGLTNFIVSMPEYELLDLYPSKNFSLI